MTLPAELSDTFDALARVWPPRSLSGMGNRRSLDVLETVCGPIRRIEIPSGAKIFDWVCPPEWTVREAYILTPDGRRICDVRANHLHLVGYSVPFSGILSRGELDRRLHSLPQMPNAIPYVTRYYSEPPEWGFCISHTERLSLGDGDYQIVCDTTLAPGHLTLGEIVIPGETDREIMCWSYLCHPAQMAHHDTSANLTWAYLAKRVAEWPRRRMTYRFVIGPETIGSLAYLAHLRPDWAMGHFRADVPYALVVPDNADFLRAKLHAGFVMTCLGRGAWNYKRSKNGGTVADRSVEYVFWHYFGDYGIGGEAHDYFATEGSDELVFNRFGLPVGSLMRDRYNRFPEYHTSADDKSTISFATIADSIDVYERVLKVIEANETYRCVVPGVPQLGRRGLYGPGMVSAATSLYQFDNEDLLTVAMRTGIDIHKLATMAKMMEDAGVLERV